MQLVQYFVALGKCEAQNLGAISVKNKKCFFVPRFSKNKWSMFDIYLSVKI